MERRKERETGRRLEDRGGGDPRQRERERGRGTVEEKGGEITFTKQRERENFKK